MGDTRPTPPDHARSITERLANSLAEWEIRAQNLPESRREGLFVCLAAAWYEVTDAVEHGRADLSVEYLTRLYGLLILSEPDAPGGFSDEGEPMSWTAYLREAAAEGPPEDASVLSELHSGKHVPRLAFSLGWLAMNLNRLRQGLWTIHPPVSDHVRLKENLDWAGPDAYDAEGLRALLHEYAQGQKPA